MPKDRLSGGVLEPVVSSEERVAVLVGAVALSTFAAGYELGSVLAGDPLEVAWLLPVAAGAVAAVVALFVEDE